jgi:hypothetical protein
MFGLDRARELASESYTRAREALAAAQGMTGDLERIAEFIYKRHA